jgi:hypothetical protein
MSREVMQLALDALRNHSQQTRPMFITDRAIAILEFELAKPEPEPVAWVRFCSDGCYEGPLMNESMELTRKISGVWTPLYRKEDA